MSRRRAGTGQLRIIGGRWRGRRLEVPPNPGLRPTPDRVRETLFNWLAPIMEGAHCLDAFAGTGALGLEALSRGAVRCDFVEQDRSLAGILTGQLERLGATHTGRVNCASWPGDRANAKGPYDLVFLDPPFGRGLLEPALEAAIQIIKPEHRVYVECPPDEFDALPAGWSALRSGRAGQVSFGLLQFERNGC